MENILPVDLPNLFLAEIEKQRRPPDGLLHPSGDLIGSLRHSMLRAAGAPMIPRPIAQDIRLMHGTIWHDWFHRVLEQNGIVHENEVNLTEWMPEGWSGTADWLFWHPEYEAWVLGDLKTTKGEAMYWLGKKGAKDEHIWQLSAYWHALVASGRPMVKGFGVMYWPMNDTSDTVSIEPVVHECDPIPEDVILPVMTGRWAETQAYLLSLPFQPGDRDSEQHVYQSDGSHWITDALAPEQDRVQKLVWDKNKSQWDVRLVPHWSAAFCDFPDELCGCSQQGTTKIGAWVDNISGAYEQEDSPIFYWPRKGYEEIEPEVKPNQWEIKKRIPDA